MLSTLCACIILRVVVLIKEVFFLTRLAVSFFKTTVVMAVLSENAVVLPLVEHPVWRTKLVVELNISLFVTAGSKKKR